MTAQTSSYQELETRFARRSRLQDAAGVLQWDMAVMMPDGGAEARAEQLSTMKVLTHEMLTDPALGDFFDAAAEDRSLDPWQQANLREMRRSWLRATAVPSDLVRALSEAGSRCEMLWREAKAASDFASILKPLEEVTALVIRRGEALSDALGLDLYDALLDGYEPDGRSADIDAVFEDLADFLPDFIDDALAHQAKRGDPLPLDGPFALDIQRPLCRRMMQTVGFDFGRGRLDESHHPFCGGVPEDVRITTRYSQDDFMPGLMGVLHETGHALYDQGLPVAWRHQPVGDARGMSLHESQSLMIEMQCCRSPEFISYAAPLMKVAFNGSGPAWTPENIRAHYLKVERSMIRVDADEATYPAHVILRYRLERAVLSGALQLKDLPGAWNDGMRDILGVTPANDAEGCLQDIHWYDGAWGYFPTYTLGAMTAAQLFAAAVKAVPGIPDALTRGDFTPLLGWLREHVHGKGSLLSTRDLLAEATGSPLDAQYFKDHLARRYLG